MRIQRRLNPAFSLAVKRSPCPGFLLAVVAGIPHQSTFSTLINARDVAATPLVMDRLHRICDEIGFDKDFLFLDEGAEK